MNVELVVFDFDGVIVDSEVFHNTAHHRLLDESLTFWEAPPDEALVGISTPEFYRDMLARYPARQTPLPTVDELCERHYAIVLGEMTKAAAAPAPGLLTLLTGLDAAGIRMAVASSSAHALVDGALKYFGVSRYFQHVTCAEDVMRLKPAPDLYAKALSLSRVPPAAAWAVEDSAVGAEAAVNAGLRCYGVRAAGSGDQDLSKTYRVLASLPELLLELA